MHTHTHTHSLQGITAMPTNNDNLLHWTAKLAGLGSTVWEGIIHSLKYAQFEAWLLINCSVCWQAFIIISLIPRPPGPHRLHGICEGVNIVAFVPNKSPLVWTVSFTVVIEIWNCPSVLLSGAVRSCHVASSCLCPYRWCVSSDALLQRRIQHCATQDPFSNHPFPPQW